MSEVDNLAGLVAEFESACGTFTAYSGQQAEQKFASAKHALLTALASLSARNQELELALRRIAGGTEDVIPPFRATGPDQMRRIARAALSPTDAVGEKDPLSAEERDTLQSLLNGMGFGRSFEALKKLMAALPASAPQNGEG